MNGTLATWNQVMNGTIGGITWDNAVNGTLFTTALYNTNYTANDANYRSITNTSYALDTKVNSIGNWTADKGLYTLISELISLVGNWTLDKPSYMTYANWNATNTSYKTITDYNTNYTANDADYRDKTNTSYYLDSNPKGYYNVTTAPIYVNDTFGANYSTFLTHIDWAKVVNGTILSQAGFNSNYSGIIGIDTSTNTSLKNWIVAQGYISSEGLWNANYTDFLEKITWDNAINGTLALTSDLSNYYALNNPFGYYNSTNPSPDTDTFAGNYSNFTTVYGYALNDTNWNSSGLIKDWNASGLIKDWTSIAGISWANAINGTLALSSTLNNGSYLNVDYNSSGLIKDWNATGYIKNWNATGLIANWSGGITEETLWNANYSTFLEHIDWSKAINGTLMKSADWNATNTSYYLQTNPFAFYNVTTAPTYLNDTFRGTNYTNFTTIYAYALNNTGITWANAINGTLMKSSDWNATNTSYMLASDWNATNTSYYLVSNPFGYYNSTNPSPDTDTFVANYSNFSTVYGYALNSTDTDTFVANYSTFLTHIDWAKVINGTIVKQTDFNSNYTGIIGIDISTNNSLKNWIDAQAFLTAFTELDPKWTANYSNFLIAYNYAINSTGDTSWVNNYSTFLTHIDWSKVINGTVLKQADFNTNYSGILGIDTATNTTMKNYVDLLNASSLIRNWNATGFIQNWSAIISSGGMTWANAINGTLARTDVDEVFDKNVNVTKNLTVGSGTSYLDIYYNGTLDLFDTLGNNAQFTDNVTADNFIGYGGFLTGIATWAQAMNNTLAQWTQVMNGTLMKQTTFNTNYSGILGIDTATNTSMKNYVDLLNATGLIKDDNATGYIKNWNATGYIKDWGAGTDTFIANYSAFLTHIDWSKVINGTVLKQADFNTNYSSSLAKLGANTFTGNQNMSTNNITFTNATSGGGYICLNQACTSYLRNNGTGTVLVGG
jgi:hypothetical protein